MSAQTINPRLIDHANNLLAAEPALNDDQRADLWDAYHSASDSRDLANRIAQFGAPDHVKQALVTAKRISDPDNQSLPEPEATVVRVLFKLSQIDPKLLALAEKHPNILSALIKAASRMGA